MAGRQKECKTINGILSSSRLADSKLSLLRWNLSPGLASLLVMRPWLPLLTMASAFAQMDPQEIVRRSVTVDDQSWKLARNYTYVQREIDRELDSSGKVKTTHARTREVMYIGQRPYRRLLEKDGHPLSPADEKKEKEKLDKVIAERNRETPAARDKRVAEYEKRRAKQREELKDIPNAFNFKLAGEEKLESGNAYVIEATPRLSYRGKEHNFLNKLRGKFWIDKADYHWVKVEAETLDTISFGLFIARLARGSRLTFEQVRVNNEVWLPKRAAVTASARLGLVKKLNLEEETTWSNFRKFQTDSRLTSASELQPK
jgi:hypothetical protein